MRDIPIPASDASISPAPRASEAWRVLAVLVAVKVAWLCCDAVPRLFLGDSASYLLAASSDWMPPDRSFTYPWFLRWTVMRWDAPLALGAVQSALGIASAMLLWHVLRRRAGVGPRVALFAAALFATEPAQVFYERMAMAEALGGLALLAFFAAAVHYVATARVRWLVAMQCIGLAAVSLRMNLLPVVLGIGVLAPLVLAWERRATPWAWRRSFAHAATAVVVLAALHGGYRQVVAHAFGGRPAWNARSGLMQFGLVAPLVKPEHLWAEGVSPNVLGLLRHDLRDPAERNAQMWSAFGMADVLGFNSGPDGDALAGRIAKRALRDDPIGFVALGIGNAAQYFDRARFRERLEVDVGATQPYDAPPQQLARKVLHADVAGGERRESPARHWFRCGATWLVACWLLLAPLGVAAWWRLRRGPHEGTGMLLALFAIGLAAGQLLFAATISFRYLHPMPPFVLFALAVLVSRGGARKTRGA